jgi:hypothetical protein
MKNPKPPITPTEATNTVNWLNGILKRKQKLVISFVKLKEKFKAIGLFPVKLVERKSPQSLGDAANNTKFDKTGNNTPTNLIVLFKKSIFNFLFSTSKFINNKKGIKKRDVGLIIMLIPKITLPMNCHEFFL